MEARHNINHFIDWLIDNKKCKDDMALYDDMETYLKTVGKSYASTPTTSERVTDEEAYFPILLETITEELFNERDLYFCTSDGDLRLCIAWGECVDKKETYMYWYIKMPVNKWLSQSPVRGEEEHYKWENGIMICNYLKKECPINDTVAGSTCPMCVHNPNQTEVVYNTEK